MPVIPLTLAGLWAPIAFGDRPPAISGAPRERVVLGRWFDGSRKREVEEAIWLSPQAVLRQGWAWEQARSRFDGTLTFAVRLTALERQDPLELGGDTAPGDDPSRAMFTLDALDAHGGATPIPLEILIRWTQRGREPGELLSVPWLAFVFGDPPERLPLNVGQNHIGVYELRAPLSPAAATAVAFRLKVTTARRTRTAVFRRWPG